MHNLNRYQYKLTEDDIGALLAVSGAWPGEPIRYPSESGKLVWDALGSRMGFDPSTVLRVPRLGYRFFTAIPIETEEQQKTREMEEYEKERLEKISKMKQEVEALLTEIRILEENK